jgi:hypothetical protein
MPSWPPYAHQCYLGKVYNLVQLIRCVYIAPTYLHDG